MAPADEWNDETGPPIPLGPTEGLEFEPVIPPKPVKRRRGLKLFILIAVLGGTGYGGWLYMDKQKAKSPVRDVPLVRADFGPVKIRPANPGGMQVPDQDKLVYDEINKSGERQKVERLLPSAEEPKPLPAPPPPIPGDMQDTQQAQTAPPQAEVPTRDEVQSAAPPAPPPPAPPAPPPVTTSAPSAPVLSAAPVAPTISTSLPSSKGYQIQLAAARSRELAESEWKRLKSKHGDLLEGLAPIIVRADLGPEKGIYFRLRAGPAGNEGAARDLCGRLSDRKVGCLVIKPQG